VSRLGQQVYRQAPVFIAEVRASLVDETVMGDSGVKDNAAKAAIASLLMA